MRFRVLLLRCGVFLAGLIPVANTPAQSVRAATRPEQAAVTSWVAALRDGSGKGLARAQRGFAKTGRAIMHEELEQLVALLHDPRSKVRAAAAAAIGAVGAGAQVAYPELVSALSDSVPAVRAEAAWALSMVARGTEAVVPAAIVDALTDRSTLVSVRALEALRVFTTPAAMLPKIDALLADSIPASRLAGLRLLRGLSDRSLSLARIVALLDDSDVALRLEAAWALEALGPSASSALPFLENRRGDVEADVREAVDDALRAIRRPVRMTNVSPQDNVSCAHRPVDRRIPTNLTVLTGFNISVQRRTGGVHPGAWVARASKRGLQSATPVRYGKSVRIRCKCSSGPCGLRWEEGAGPLDRRGPFRACHEHRCPLTWRCARFGGAIPRVSHAGSESGHMEPARYASREHRAKRPP